MGKNLHLFINITQKVSPPPPEHLSQYCITQGSILQIIMTPPWSPWILNALLNIERFQRIPYTTHRKLDRQKITPLSYKNIYDKPCVKRLKACQFGTKMCRTSWTSWWYHYIVSILLALRFMKYCYKYSGLTFYLGCVYIIHAH